MHYSLLRWLAVFGLSGVLTRAQPAGSAAAASFARLDSGQAVLGNGALERTIRLTDPVQTIAFSNKVAGKDIAVTGAEFALRLNETQLLTAADFVLRDARVEDAGQGAKQLILTLLDANDGLELRLTYEVTAADPYMRKRLGVRTVGASTPLLNSVDVEQFSTPAACDLGGRGQPIFVSGHCFAGLEYPAGLNEVVDLAKARPPGVGFQVALRHRPGKVLAKEFLYSKSAVFGVGGDGAAERAFAHYLSRIRIPPRSFVHYNSWYDIRQASMSTSRFLETFAAFKQNLCDPYGVKLDSFVPDDGWQDRNSIWEINATLFPNGFGELAAGLQAGGSSLGLWHPLTAVKGNLDMAWCQAHGYETDKAGSHLCVSAPKHNAQLRAVMTRHLKESGVNYFKHDFNSFGCDGEGHGHLPRSEYGFEANVDAYIELLQLFKQLNPDIFLNCTGGMWLSPWWLQYCDTVWRGASDTGYEKAYPFVDQRAQAISYVDGVLWDDFVRFRYQFPLSALMVHGIVYGQLHLLGGREEPLESWADNAVWSMNLGLMMKELYITPSLLSPAHWEILARALLWAEAHKDTLVETQMVGGNPHVGEVMGYKHAVGNRTLIYLRNPSLRPQSTTVDLAPPEVESSRRVVEVVYPYRKLLDRDADPARGLPIELGPYEMVTIEAFPAAEIRRPLLAGCRYAVVSQSDKEYVYEVSGAGGAHLAVTVVSPARIAQILLDDVEQTATGSEPTLNVVLPAAPLPLEAVDASGVGAPLRNRVRVTLPDGLVEGRFALICEKTSGALTLGTITVNGSEAKARALEGERWKASIVSLGASANEIGWSVPVTARPRVPFSARSFVMSAYAWARRPLATRRLTVRLAESVGPPAIALPTPFSAQATDFVRLQAPREVQTVPPGGPARITQADLRTIKAARLHFTVFGVNGEEMYRNKPVTLNGGVVGILPTNSASRLDQWEEKTLEVPAEQWARIAAGNVVTVAGCGGDCFKIVDVALAVQLADGTWAESNHDNTIYCAVGPSWLHFEGTPFIDSTSPDIHLALPLQ